MLSFLLYIDPGSGSYLIQAIVAAVLGVAFFFKNIGHFFKNFWLYIKAIFYRPKQK